LCLTINNPSEPSTTNIQKTGLKVSIVTPSFNRGAFIETTIQSVIGQSHDNIEYIVVDGGSTDDTLEILEKYRIEGRLTYLSEPDSGMYDAINKGFAIATGDIVAYLNTDDLYFPWTVSTAVEGLFDIETDMIFGDSMVIDYQTNSSKINIYPSFSKTYLRMGNLIPQPTVFMKRKVLETVGIFGIDLKYLADCEYWLRAIRAGFRMVKIHEVLAIECNHGETLRNKHAVEIEKEKVQLRDTYKPMHIFPGISCISRLMKYVEKELLYLMFRMRLYPFMKRPWKRFNASYNCTIDLLSYYKSKIFRYKPDNTIWQISERDRG
jgi:glycosyltransferase involved in cell wall biosynthesis